MIVLDRLRKIIPDIPVLFLATGYRFAQTYAYRDRVAKEWHLRSSTCFRTNLWLSRSVGILHQSNPTQCCQLHKVEPLSASRESELTKVRAIWIFGCAPNGGRQRGPHRGD
jgi:phosphoadenosine phosphosulfate reductase